MATFVKLNCLTQNLAHKIHNFNTDQLVVALVASANPLTLSFDQLNDLVEVSYTYCSARNVTKVTSAQINGLYKLVLQDLVLTATGGPVGPFRYVVLYNDTSSIDALIGYYDYGTNVTLNAGDTFTIDFDGDNGVFTLG